jgi:uncharacterized protein (DUF2267 family)
MQINVNKYTAEANRFLHEVAAELGDPISVDAAARVSVAVFHSLRERLSVDESFQLLAQLPMIMKGVYVDGWDPSQQTDPLSLKNFISQLREHDRIAASRDFGTEEQAIRNIQAVLRVMAHYVSEEQMKIIKQKLPRPVAEIFDTW